MLPTSCWRVFSRPAHQLARHHYRRAATARIPPPSDVAHRCSLPLLHHPSSSLTSLWHFSFPPPPLHLTGWQFQVQFIYSFQPHPAFYQIIGDPSDSSDHTLTISLSDCFWAASYRLFQLSGSIQLRHSVAAFRLPLLLLLPHCFAQLLLGRYFALPSYIFFALALLAAWQRPLHHLAHRRHHWLPGIGQQSSLTSAPLWVGSAFSSSGRQSSFVNGRWRQVVVQAVRPGFQASPIFPLSCCCAMQLLAADSCPGTLPPSTPAAVRAPSLHSSSPRRQAQHRGRQSTPGLCAQQLLSTVNSWLINFQIGIIVIFTTH